MMEDEQLVDSDSDNGGEIDDNPEDTGNDREIVGI